MSTHYNCKHGKAYWQFCKECYREEKEVKRLEYDQRIIATPIMGFTVMCNICGSLDVDILGDPNPEFLCNTCGSKENL